MENINNRFDLLADWLEDDTEIQINHIYESSDYKFRKNYELVDLSSLTLFNNPISLCQEAVKLIDKKDGGLTHPVAGRILSSYGDILFQFFPGSYGFTATFSLLSREKYSEMIGSGTNFNQQARIILRPGWHDSREDRFTKIELLHHELNTEIVDIIETIKLIKKELIKGLCDGPQNAGGHTSDHSDLYDNALGACALILKKYS